MSQCANIHRFGNVYNTSFISPENLNCQKKCSHTQQERTYISVVKYFKLRKK
jgi:hypothetical protein